MNNLSGFTDVINSLRQAIFTLNTQIHQVRVQVDEIKTTRDTNNGVNELTESLQHFRETYESKVNELFNDVNKLSEQLNELKLATSQQSQSPSLTIEDVQQLIDNALSQLLEGVQPMDTLLREQQSLADITTPTTITVEPPTINEVTQAALEVSTPKATTTKRTSRKKA